ncbi:unnamed protein product [Caretta caretta]
MRFTKEREALFRCVENTKQFATGKKQQKSILDLEKERLQLLCNILNTYNQHLSHFGQNLIAIHSAISQVDAEKDIQTLLEEMSVFSPETKSEFLLMDYYVRQFSLISFLMRSLF